ncbi:MAG: exodeoxyribonuclease V subunit gamma [gamma proteobacterium symbiont of Bathyaustriella thionipta]|nr:exodeoxyribonuclease V subunit gamma [gamma proteobacterium symbiont of Bathyaustriella thionipta]
MSLHLISSNRVETLADTLSAYLQQQPLSGVLTSEVILVPGAAMARWLHLHLARQNGIASNIQYPLPANWVWQLADTGLTDEYKQDPLDRSAASWKIFALLPELLQKSAFQSIRHYLQDDENDLKRWQLASRIADVFDRYQYYRPQLIQDWDKGLESDWQALLWRELGARLDGSHRVAVIHQLIHKLQQGQVSSLPERISLFALSSLPPLLLDLIMAVAGQTQVFLYQHSPSDQYWADLKSKKALSRMRLQSADDAAYYDTGNDLLASWGRQGQALQDLLLSHNDLQSAEWEAYQPPHRKTLLSSVQLSIFQLQEQQIELTADASLQLHICHSAWRECQVLHDELLRLLQNNSKLLPEDILVMIPNVADYAPYIQAVFKKDEQGSRPFIPWNLSDIPVLKEQALMPLFFQLLDLPASRFTYSEISAWLDSPAILRRFDLSPTDCEDILGLLQQARVRWGIDAQHKAQLELPALLENTWKQAEQRLYAGYALGDVDSWNGIAPLSENEGDKSKSLARFWIFFSRLQQYRQRLSDDLAAADWQALLNQLLDDFFSPQDEDEQAIQQIRDALQQLGIQASGQILSPALLRHCLQSELQENRGRGRYFSGGVTFCGMRPMRSLPFKVICLLGMNEHDFPRRERRPEFDRMAKQWQPGDPLKGDEDRYLLLETLLCARETLYISYTGRSLKDNTELQPSVLLRELLDYMDEQPAQDQQQSRISEQITRHHPMQAFHAENFQLLETAGYDHYWLSIAQSLAAPSSPVSEHWPDTEIPLHEQEGRDIQLKQLIRFVKHPVKFFFNQRLRIYLTEQDKTQDDELFTLDHLQQWQLKTLWADDYLQQAEPVLQQLKAQGVLPHGVAAELSFAQTAESIQPVLQQLAAFKHNKPQPLLIDLALDHGLHLGGRIESYRPNSGLLHVSPSKFKGKILLALWIEHLALCATCSLADNERSTLICQDKSIYFEPIEEHQALRSLQHYLDLYRLALQKPLPVFNGASFAWAQAADDEEKAQKKALSQWQGNEYNKIPGDKDDVYIQLALHGHDSCPIAQPEFIQRAQDFYAEPLQDMKIL